MNAKSGVNHSTSPVLLSEKHEYTHCKKKNIVKIAKKIAAFVLTSLLVGGSMAATGAAANATPMIATGEEAVSSEGLKSIGPDGEHRSIVPDEVNTSSYQGLSATINKAPTDKVVLLDGERTFVLQNATGDVLLNSVNPKLGDPEHAVDAKFIVEGDKVIITPVNGSNVRMARAALNCAPAYWGNLIFNIGMWGVCAMIGIGTGGVGGVVRSMAVIGANLGIDWNKPCN